MKTGLIVTLHNDFEVLGGPCLRSAFAHMPSPRVIVAIDNESEPAVEPIDERDLLWLRVADQRQHGFLTGSWNMGANLCLAQGCDRVIFLNHDTVLDASFANFCRAITDDDLIYGPVSDEPGHAVWQQASQATPDAPQRPVKLVNGFCFGLTAQGLDKSRLRPGVFFHPDLPFAGNEDEFQIRHAARGGRAVLVPSAFVAHKKRSDWRQKFPEFSEPDPGILDAAVNG